MITERPSPVRASALKSRLELATDTLEFRFEKPPGMTFVAGQSLDLSLIAPPETDDEGDTRTYSIASAPEDDDLAIATRLRDTAFKRTLQAMPIGTAVQIEGPAGEFTLHEDVRRPAVLLAGGIGVTPFRSMVRQEGRRGGSRRIFLFHSNHRPEEAPYLDEFRRLAAGLQTFTYVPTMSRPETSTEPWKGQIGRIEYPLIARHLEGTDGKPVYYVAGPPKMVAALLNMLTEAGIADDDMRYEEFEGY